MSRTTSQRSLWPSSIAFLLFIFIMLTSTTLRRVDASPYFIPTSDNMTDSSEYSVEDLMTLMNNSEMNWMNNSMVNSTNSWKMNSTNSSKVNSTNNPMVNSTNNPMVNSTNNPMVNSMNNPVVISTSSSMENSTEISSNTDVYVIKAVVYEIGILTDTNSTTMSSENNESTERQESIDISLYSVPQEDEFS